MFEKYLNKALKTDIFLTQEAGISIYMNMYYNNVYIERNQVQPTTHFTYFAQVSFSHREIYFLRKTWTVFFRKNKRIFRKKLHT